jgi:hypothetical protein
MSTNAEQRRRNNAEFRSPPRIEVTRRGEKPGFNGKTGFLNAPGATGDLSTSGVRQMWENTGTASATRPLPPLCSQRVVLSMGGSRRGLALIVVMVAISAALVLTYALVRTQTTSLQISRNGSRRDWARQAAETGAAVAVERIQSTDWAGVATSLSRQTSADSSGTVSYTITFRRLESSDFPTLPGAAALYVVIQSTGIWQAADDANNRVERRVEVVVRLSPRVDGRPINTGDSLVANDRAPNISGFDEIQKYALFADRGRTSLVLEPGHRIDGDVWLNDKLRLYQDPFWSASIRRDVLESIGSRYVSASGASHPHPLSGRITFKRTPSDSVKNDLAWLGVSWNNAPSSLSLPAVTFSDWQTYRLYEGGFEYSAVEIGGSLRNVTLGPTPDNPLGVFYHSGPVVLDDNVTIRGTLVCTDKVSIVGDRVRFGSFNWRNDSGEEIVSGSAGWPRLPAIVALDVFIDLSVRFTVDGAVVVTRKLDGAGGDFEYVQAPDVSINGTATSRPLGQPFSEVQLEGTPDISSLTTDGKYSIWLDDGLTGGWHEIIGVDSFARRLTVVGEVQHPSPTTFRIRRTRKRYADIRGPIACEKTDINHPPAWVEPLSEEWDILHDEWNAENATREVQGLEPIPFVDWLADPVHFNGWGSPRLLEYGLRLEPTFHLRNTDGIAYQWSPPLFRAFAASGADEQFAGYRWQVISWRQVK